MARPAGTAEAQARALPARPASRRGTDRASASSRAASLSGTNRPQSGTISARADGICSPELERCDGIDNDCDGEVDEEGAVGCRTAYIDEDRDGFGGLARGCFCSVPAALVARGSDCDDSRAEVHPGASEVCDGQIDNDCDGGADLCGAASQQTLLPGDLAVHAVHDHTDGIDDALAESFEIENLTDRTIELMGLEVRDDGVDGFHIHRSLVLEPGASAVLGRNGDPASNGGVELDYVYSDFILSNTGDAIELRSDGVIIDHVVTPTSEDASATSMR